MARSVSVRTSVKDTSIDHNNRTNPKELKNRGEHIDFSRSKNNLTLIKKPIREVYEEEFHGAVLEYNKRQKRKDRQISTRKGGYYRKVRTDMTLDVQREFIFQVGRKEDEPLSDELLDEMYTEFYKGFKERHPDLRVFNAVVHHDEGGVPHLHINAVPVAKGYKKGMAKRPSFSKMLKKEGVSFKEFCNNERNELAAVMKEYTGEDRLLVGTHDYLLPQQYRDLMKKGQEDIQNLKDDMINHMNEQNNIELEKLKKYKKNLELANKGIKQKQAEQEKQANELAEQRKKLDARSSNLSEWAKNINNANEILKANNDTVNKRKANLLTKSKELDARDADLTEREDTLNAFAKNVKEKNDNVNEKLDKVGKKEIEMSKREMSLNVRETSLRGKESEYERKVSEFHKSIDRQQELNAGLIAKLQDLLRRATDRTLAKLNEIKARTERLKHQNQSDFVTGLEDLNRIADVSEEGTQTEFNKNLKKATDIADLNFFDFGGLDDKQL